MSTVDPRALAVFADAARQLGAELRDEDAEEALRYVVHLWAVRVLGGLSATQSAGIDERCVSCGRVVRSEYGMEPHRETCEVLRAWAALDLPQGHAAVGAAFDWARRQVPPWDFRVFSATEAEYGTPFVQRRPAADVRLESVLREATEQLQLRAPAARIEMVSERIVGRLSAATVVALMADGAPRFRATVTDLGDVIESEWLDPLRPVPQVAPVDEDMPDEG